MENLRSDHFHPTGVIKKKEVPTKKPEDVIGFLREFDFGNPSESAQKTIERFIKYIKVRGGERLLLSEPSLVDLFVDELEKSDFIEPGTISHEKWTKKAKLALLEVLNNFNKYPKNKRVKLSKKHQDWRV